ncbi:DUF6054 family protein [Neobacillus sp. WH10]|uniref:DUF6054 family protein n=1 Tax=Neobacillus sp. WH10 TaxID=3047873 RepID=UPI0024C1646F|nr:DUF6054 family protein [Neobacillus sp. WH10]WHY78349.1 DUF6054 family protein [Neobacillus sp. WH10]
MDVSEIVVSITPKEASDKVEEEIVNGSISGTLIDRYHRSIGNIELIVLVLEKYYYRSGNRGSMTVTIDNFEGATKVHAAASGTAQGAIFRFDWGAGNSCINSVIDILEPYRVK